MDTAAYYIASVMIVITPPMIIAWFFIHPFVGFWRKVGPFFTYFTLSTFVIMLMKVIYQIREPLLSIHFGVRTPLVIISIVFFWMTMYIGAKRHQHLKIGIMFGLPEISEQRGKLLTDGIYSRLRHPRYVEIGFGIAATAFFCNYLAVYILLIAYIPVIYLVVLLEERELRNRFGVEYDEYCRRVPRFIPNISEKKGYQERDRRGES